MTLDIPMFFVGGDLDGCRVTIRIDYDELEEPPNEVTLTGLTYRRRRATPGGEQFHTTDGAWVYEYVP